MIVKLCTDMGVERVYDCKKVKWTPVKSDKNNTAQIDILIDHRGGEDIYETVVFECSLHNQFIIMNDEGKTIDRKHW